VSHDSSPYGKDGPRGVARRTQLRAVPRWSGAWSWHCCKPRRGSLRFDWFSFCLASVLLAKWRAFWQTGGLVVLCVW